MDAGWENGMGWAGDGLELRMGCAEDGLRMGWAGLSWRMYGLRMSGWAEDKLSWRMGCCWS